MPPSRGLGPWFRSHCHRICVGDRIVVGLIRLYVLCLADVGERRDEGYSKRQYDIPTFIDQKTRSGRMILDQCAELQAIKKSSSRACHIIVYMLRPTVRSSAVLPALMSASRATGHLNKD
jgi:hypothetical protein